jgi:hypothetical protein
MLSSPASSASPCWFLLSLLVVHVGHDYHGLSIHSRGPLSIPIGLHGLMSSCVACCPLDWTPTDFRCSVSPSNTGLSICSSRKHSTFRTLVVSASFHVVPVARGNYHGLVSFISRSAAPVAFVDPHRYSLICFTWSLLLVATTTDFFDYLFHVACLTPMDYRFIHFTLHVVPCRSYRLPRTLDSINSFHRSLWRLVPHRYSFSRGLLST